MTMSKGGIGHRNKTFDQAAGELKTIEREAEFARMAERAQSVVTFKELSELAARLEQSGEYSKAHAVWIKAKHLARLEINRTWCRHRSALCSVAAHKWPLEQRLAA
jgi:hypothetical protein